MIEKEPYEWLTFEVSSICNAQCKWCTTGIENRKGNSNENGTLKKEYFADAKVFEETIEYLFDKQILKTNAGVDLFNWGEPLLNPEIKKICKILSDRNITTCISSNGSRVVNFEKSEIVALESFYISMPGFSPKSYDRIHGFNFETIKSNILNLSQILKKAEFKDKITLYFHVYQFNINEILPAYEFAKKNDMNFMAVFAFLADFDYFNLFMRNKLRAEIMVEAQKELFLNFYEDCLREYTEDYVCPQYRKLVLGPQGQIIPCTFLNEKDSLGDVKKYSLDEINKLKINRGKCNLCKASGQHYIVHNIPKIKICDQLDNLLKEKPHA